MVIGAGKIGAMIAGLPGTRGDYRVTVADHSAASLAGISQNRDVQVQTLGATDAAALSELLSRNEQSLSNMSPHCVPACQGLSDGFR